MSLSQAQAPPSPLYTIQNSEQITCLLFSRFNSKIFYACTRNGHLHVYDLNIRRSIFKVNPCQQSITTILELNQNALLVYCRNGLLFRLVRETDGDWKYECVFSNANYSFCNMCLSEEANYLFVPSSESSVILCLDLNTFQIVNKLKPLNAEKSGMLMCIQVIDRKCLLAGYENGNLALFDYDTKFSLLDTVTVFEGVPLLYFDYSKKLNTGVAGCSELQLRRFFIENLKLYLIDEKIELKNPGVNCIRFRQGDNKIFASAGWDSRIRVYSAKKSKLLCVLDFHKEAVNFLTFSNENILSAGSNDGLISFWNLYNN